MKMLGKCTGPKYLLEFFVKMGKVTTGRPRFGKKSGPG